MWEWKRLARVGERQESQKELEKPPVRPGPAPAQSTAQGLNSCLQALTVSVQEEEKEGAQRSETRWEENQEDVVSLRPREGTVARCSKPLCHELPS